MPFKVGDRIETIEVDPDEDQFPPGRRGTIMFISGGESFTTVGVKWDSGRWPMAALNAGNVRKIG